MKKVLVGLALASSIAQAQTPAATTTATTSTPAATTATATEAEQTSVSKLGAFDFKRFGASFAAESFMSMDPRNKSETETDADGDPIRSEKLGSRKTVYTLYTASLKYKVSDKLSVEAMQYAASRSNLEPSGDVGYVKGQSGLWDAALKANYKTDMTVFGSKPLTVSGRYYFPISEVSREKKQAGTARLDVNPSWDLNSKVSLDLLVNPRVTFYNSDAKNSDASYRLLTGLGATYNVNDNISFYTMPYVDLVSRDLGRGKYTPEARNNLNIDTGANFSFGPVTINPAIVSTTDLNNRSSSIFTSNSKVYSAEKSEIDLNVYATF